MKAIITKYLGPTNYKGSRIKASDMDRNSVIIPYDSGLDSEKNHENAAKALCDKMGWKDKMVHGGLPTGYAFVFVQREYLPDSIQQALNSGDGVYRP